MTQARAAGQGDSLRQFAESPDFDEAVVAEVSENQEAHNKIADYFFSGAPGRPVLVRALAKAFYELDTDAA